ncbi:cytochrome c [Rhodocytophaga rosea]|uniref:Cytochrome c n=1 Tax=Rhodocytophaga rosea TaxID=2704465 RepID=A0A6C0GMC0_9BACT|nr:c-type cytochrome [Rhodocytophaga rosea]QHT68780.1 cytochrome c [Rhodocytophaga rosea]
MIRKIVKITGIVLAGLFLLTAVFYLVAYQDIQERINKVYDINPEPITVHYDTTSIQLGTRLAIAKGCTGCHSADLGGRIFIDDAHKLGYFVASNLTSGKGGLPEGYGYRDWVLAIKHGIRRNGKPLFIMPSHEFNSLTERDMGAIIAYASNLPAINREFEKSQLGPLGTVLTYLNKIPLLPAEKIDHSRKMVKQVKAEVSADYGKYLSATCQGCHRPNMKGGEPLAPGFPPVPDISSTGHPGSWTHDQFVTTIRTGKTPEGKPLDPKEMPWKSASAFTDDELTAIHLYLNSL